MFGRLGQCFVLFWRLLRVQFQILYGAWRILKLQKPIVSIFGSARMQLDDQYAHKAHTLAQKLAEKNISVLTGGGPGIMEAASCAIAPIKGKGRSIGIGVKDLGEGLNPCSHESFELDYFFARKWLLTRYSVGFIVFPGGFGTLDELAEVLTLIQTKKLKRVPIVLIGVEYWDDFMVWVKKEALVHKLIAPEDIKLLTLTDDLDEAFSIIRKGCEVENEG